MAKAEKYLQLDAFVAQTLGALGYKTELEEDEDGTQIDSLINGTSFAVYYGADSETVGYGVVFEPQEEIGDEEFYAIVESLRCEQQPFDNLMEDEEGLLHLEGEVDIEDFTEELLKAIVETLTREKGAVSKLKALSYVWEEE